tara:strand:- start:86 stop:535 length:450 start_codon:yes stop_codon:yes gene_type:complete
MAHFAQLDDKNIVTQVIVVGNDDISDVNGDEVESIGVAFCQKLLGANTNWKQTSYNGKMRGNYAGIGMTYMTGVRTMGLASTDVFIAQQPYPSWSIGINTASWFSPVGECPGITTTQQAEGKYYIWDEDAHQADTNNPKTVGWALTSNS